jgi:outer membrane protein assembly factor BamB
MSRLLRTALICAVVLTPVTLVSTGGSAGARTRPTMTKLTKLWTARLVGPGSAPVVADSGVYVTAIDPKLSKRSAATASDLYAFDATCLPAPARCAKTLEWVHPYPAIDDVEQWYATNLTPAATGNGDVYVGENQIGTDQYDGTEQAFVATSGSPVFSSRQGGTSTPTVADGVVASNWVFQCCFAEENLSGTEVLNASTGAQLFTTFSAPSSPPAIGAGSLFVVSGGVLAAYDASGKTCVPPSSVPPSELEEYESATGFPEVCTPLWSAATSGTIAASVTVAGSEMYVGTSDNHVYAFPAAGCGTSECQPDWTGTVGGAVTTSVAVSSSTAFVTSSDGVLSAFPAGGCGSPTCVPEWTGTVGGSLSAPTVAGSLVYVTSTNGELAAFPVDGCGTAICSPSGQGTLRAPSDTQPAAGTGVIFVTDMNHDLYAFRQPS